MEKKLLLKYIEGDCNIQEKVMITEWLDSNPQNMREYLALRRLHDITIWQENKSQKTIQKKSTQTRKNIYLEVLKIAAVLIVAFLGSYFFLSKDIPKNQVAMQTLNVPAGQRAEITLADGTSVWLNARTRLTFPSRFSGDKRVIELDGEGFFDVTSDKSKPFIVKTDKFDVKVLGTRFNLMAYSGSEVFETSLLEGIVEISKPNASKGVMISANERIFLENGKLIIAPITNTGHLLWKEGIISFDDEKFLEMAKKLELYFDRRIEVKNKKILDFRCTGKFRTKDGLEHILQVLQLKYNFSFTIDDNENIITIN